MEWWLLVLLTPDRSATYGGITTDVERRLKQHNDEASGGPRSTTRRRPWVAKRTLGPFLGRTEAQVAECRIKKMRGNDRLTGTIKS